MVIACLSVLPPGPLGPGTYILFVYFRSLMYISRLLSSPTWCLTALYIWFRGRRTGWNIAGLHYPSDRHPRSQCSMNLTRYDERAQHREACRIRMRCLESRHKHNFGRLCYLTRRGSKCAMIGCRPPPTQPLCHEGGEVF